LLSLIAALFAWSASIRAVIRLACNFVLCDYLDEVRFPHLMSSGFESLTPNPWSASGRCFRGHYADTREEFVCRFSDQATQTHAVLTPAALRRRSCDGQLLHLRRSHLHRLPESMNSSGKRHDHSLPRWNVRSWTSTSRFPTKNLMSPPMSASCGRISSMTR